MTAGYRSVDGEFDLDNEALSDAAAEGAYDNSEPFDFGDEASAKRIAAWRDERRKRMERRHARQGCRPAGSLFWA